MTKAYQAGKLLGQRYKLLTPIAQGGMGEVWKARDEVTLRLVAVKVLRQELSGQDVPLNRLRTEARNAMKVEHPNIASVLDSGEEDGRGWIVMELVEGRPLSDYLVAGNRLPVEDLLPVMLQSSLALQALQDADVVHRDVKPANILIRDDGVVKLTDFGISLATGQPTMTAAGMVMGTAQYLPPEQAMGKTATTSGDLYALGVIGYEAIAGRRPFTGPTAVDIAFSHVNDPVPALPEDVPAPFASVIMRLLSKNPEERPGSGSALAAELVKVARVLGIPAQPRPLPDPPAGANGEGEHPSVTPIPPVIHQQRRALPQELVDDDPLAGIDSHMAKIQAAGDAPVQSRYRSASAAAAAAAAAEAAAGDPEATEVQAAVRADGVPTPSAQRPASTSAKAPSSMNPPRRRRAERATPTSMWQPLDADPVPSAPDGPGTRTPGGNAPTVATTRFSRSKVAPPAPRSQTIGMAVIVALVVLTLLLIAYATITNRIGSLPIGLGTTVNQEVQTWQTPPHIA